MRLLLLLLCLQPALLSAAPRVVTSIAPLHEIASALMAGVGKPQLIIDKHQSAHHFAFKPSHMRRLQQADLVIWVDRHFEAGFSRVPEILPTSTQTLELMPALDIDGGDGHFWYSPALLQKSITLMAAKLIALDPDNQSHYRDNAQQLKKLLSAWRERLQKRWHNTTLRLTTDHGFLAHFAAEFEHIEIESIQDHHDAHGSLKDLQQVEQWLQSKPSGCLLTLASLTSPLASSLAAKYQLAIINITAVSDMNPASGALLQRLEQLAKALEKCAQQGK